MGGPRLLLRVRGRSPQIKAGKENRPDRLATERAKAHTGTKPVKTAGKSGPNWTQRTIMVSNADFYGLL